MDGDDFRGLLDKIDIIEDKYEEGLISEEEAILHVAAIAVKKSKPVMQRLNDLNKAAQEFISAQDKITK